MSLLASRMHEIDFSNIKCIKYHEMLIRMLNAHKIFSRKCWWWNRAESSGRNLNKTVKDRKSVNVKYFLLFLWNKKLSKLERMYSCVWVCDWLWICELLLLVFNLRCYRFDLNLFSFCLPHSHRFYLSFVISNCAIITMPIEYLIRDLEKSINLTFVFAWHTFNNGFINLCIVIDILFIHIYNTRYTSSSQ